MHINKITIYPIELPFKGDFSISIRKGLSSRIVLVEIVDQSGGIRGYGEALPVKDVTGETTGTVIDSINDFIKNRRFPWDLENVTQIWRFVDSLPDVRYENAARCAIETALLDALGKGENKSVLEYFDHRYLTTKVKYGASITLGDRQKVEKICRLIHSFGINHLRIKMGKDFHQNRDTVEVVRAMFSDDCEIRIDPNQVWDSDLAFKHIPLIEENRIRIVEEPFPTDNPRFREYFEIMTNMGVGLMACESAVTLDDIRKIAQEGYYGMINVKLCRSGGFRRSLKMIDYIRNLGLRYQIGCSLGESGLLSAAGRALCLLSGDAVYYDGSYDKFILAENTTVEPVSFKQGGEAGPLNGPGLGVGVDPENLKRLCAGTKAISIKKSYGGPDGN